MLLTQTNRLHLSMEEAQTLRTLCRLSKNLYNVGLYTVRQYFFTERKHLRYESAYHHCKTNENYKLLATDIGQQTLKVVDRAFQSFFGLLEAKRTGTFTAKLSIPRYLDKEGYFALIIPIRARQVFKDWKFPIPLSRDFKRLVGGSVTLEIPERLRGKRIKEIRIYPKYNARAFDVSYIYESEDVPAKVNPEYMMGVDLGMDNLAACVTTKQTSFVIDGKRLKSVNQWFNKRNSQLQAEKDKQGIKGFTEQQCRITDGRNRRVKDYLNKAARYIINHCIDQGVGKVVVGYNPGMKQDSNMGTRNNQNFVQVPIFTLRLKLKSLCERYGIAFIEQEESYTSKSSFVDGDPIPVYNADNPLEFKGSGKRIKRGLYRTKKGWLINADINGAANILKKHLESSQDKLRFGLSRGCLAQPLRVKIS
ncbi:MAG TPA: transposase [Cyanobacteria bacterium UBA11372]|nr:transposase [Cyanobacteria bacterium UBA11372]